MLCVIIKLIGMLITNPSFSDESELSESDNKSDTD